MNKTIVFRLIVATALMTAVPLFSAQEAQPAGDQLEPKVVAFLNKHLIDQEIQTKLDQLFDQQTQWELLEFMSSGDYIKHEKTLNKKGFTFPFGPHDNVFRHSDFPGKIFKMPQKTGAYMTSADHRLHKNLSQYNAGRIKFGLDLQEKIKSDPQVSQILRDYNLPPKITFAKKTAYFPAKRIKNFCAVMIIAEELDLKSSAKFTKRQWRGIELLTELLNYHDVNQKNQNIIKRDHPYNDIVFADTEPKNIALEYPSLEENKS